MICTLHYSGDQMKKNELDRACGTCGGRRGACRDLVGRSERNGSLEISRGRKKDNTKMNLQEVRWKVMDWADLVLAG
jgi:hypothetical protein